MLQRYSHPNEFIKAHRNKIVRCMAMACSQHQKNYEKYADNLISLAKNCFRTFDEDSSLVKDIIRSLACNLLSFEKEIRNLKENLSPMTSEGELLHLILLSMIRMK